MEGYINILDEKILQENIKFASLFILNYECLEDFLIHQMRGFFCNDFSDKDGPWHLKESKEYLDKVKQLDPKKNKKLTAALLWFKELHAITQEDIDLFNKMRIRRNLITHELIRELKDGFSEEDAELLASMVNMYKKIDNRWFKNVEIPISGVDYGDEYDLDGAMGGQVFILSLINGVALGNAGAYEELLEAFKKIL